MVNKKRLRKDFASNDEISADNLASLCAPSLGAGVEAEKELVAGCKAEEELVDGFEVEEELVAGGEAEEELVACWLELTGCWRRGRGSAGCCGGLIGARFAEAQAIALLLQEAETEMAAE